GKADTGTVEQFNDKLVSYPFERMGECLAVKGAYHIFFQGENGKFLPCFQHLDTGHRIISNHFTDAEKLVETAKTGNLSVYRSCLLLLINQVNDPCPDRSVIGMSDCGFGKCLMEKIFELLQIGLISQQGVGAYPFFIPQVFKEGFFHTALYHPWVQAM